MTTRTRLMLGRMGRCVLAAGLIYVTACGDSGGGDSGGAGANAGSGAGMAAIAGAAAGTSGTTAGGSGPSGGAGMEGALPSVPTECEAGALPCRGACFTTVSEVHNGCELVARDTSYSISALAMTDQAIFAIDWDRNGSPTAPRNRLLRFDLPGYGVTELLIQNEFDGKLVADGGFLYVNGGYRDAEGLDNVGLVRIPQDGGELMPIVDPAPERADAVDFDVLDGYVWYFARVESGMVVNGLHRVPVGGGEPELIMERQIKSLALDATHYYFNAGFPDFDLERALRSDPTQVEVLVGDVTTATVILIDSDPDHVYFYDGEYKRVAKTGGEPETVSDTDFQTLTTSVGPEHVFVTVGPNGDLPGIYALPKQGGPALRIDDNSATVTQIAEDAQAFYFAREDGLFLIAKD